MHYDVLILHKLNQSLTDALKKSKMATRNFFCGMMALLRDILS